MNKPEISTILLTILIVTACAASFSIYLILSKPETSITPTELQWGLFDRKASYSFNLTEFKTEKHNTIITLVSNNNIENLIYAITIQPKSFYLYPGGNQTTLTYFNKPIDYTPMAIGDTITIPFSGVILDRNQTVSLWVYYGLNNKITEYQELEFSITFFTDGENSFELKQKGINLI